MSRQSNRTELLGTILFQVLLYFQQNSSCGATAPSVGEIWKLFFLIIIIIIIITTQRIIECVSGI